jgi:hypothetical protein
MELIMEPTALFALFIGMVAVVHFLDLFAEKIRSRKETKVTTTRKKWYCFFANDDLTGEKRTEDNVVRDTQQDIMSDRKQRRLQEQRRPVLRL